MLRAETELPGSPDPPRRRIGVMLNPNSGSAIRIASYNDHGRSRRYTGVRRAFFVYLSPASVRSGPGLGAGCRIKRRVEHAQQPFRSRQSHDARSIRRLGPTQIIL